MFSRRKIRCKAAHADLTAWLDGELPAGRAQRVARHVDSCAVCAAEAGTLRASVAEQREVLHAQLGAVAVDLDAMWHRLRPRLVETERVVSEPSGWLWRPTLVLAASCLVVMLGVTAVGGPDTVLISVGLEAPPAPLVRKPDLFKEYAVIEKLDVLERFETADTELILDAVTPQANQG